jgi:hypothetical protein
MKHDFLFCLVLLLLITPLQAAEEQPSHNHQGHSMTMPMAKGMVMKREEDNSSAHRSAGPTKDKMHIPVIRHGEAMEAMPMIEPKRVYTVTGKEDFESLMGYGRDEPMVGMMNLMMVEGSDMEGMEMEPMQMAADTSDPLAPENIGKYMKKPDGKTAPKPTPTEAFSIKAEVQPNPPVVGENKILFSVAVPGSGQRILDAKLTARVEMTSMDMGSESPHVKSLPDGRYEVAVRFTMAGPWRVHFEGSSASKPEAEISTDLLFEAGAKKPWVQHD